jgi:hypothetical protein
MELLNSRATMGIVHQFLHGGSGRQVAPVVLVAPLADSEPAALPATSPLPPPQPWCAATGWCPTGFRAGRPVLGRPSALGLESPGLLQSQPRPPPHRVPHAPPVRPGSWDGRRSRHPLPHSGGVLPNSAFGPPGPGQSLVLVWKPTSGGMPAWRHRSRSWGQASGRYRRTPIGQGARGSL